MYAQFLSRKTEFKSPFCKEIFEKIASFMKECGMKAPLPPQLTRDARNIIIVWDSEDKSEVYAVAFIHKANIFGTMPMKMLSQVHFCRKLLPSQKEKAFTLILELFTKKGNSGKRKMYIDLSSLMAEMTPSIVKICSQFGFDTSTHIMAGT